MACSINENKIISRVLQNCYYDLIQKLNSKSLVDYLFSKFWLSDEEKNEIQTITVRQQQNRQLLNTLCTKDEEALDAMMKYFQTDKSQKHLYDLLIESKNKIISQEVNYATAGRKVMSVLSSKWWPEEKPLINSFIERKAKSGELIVDALHKELQTNQGKSTAIISNNKHSIVGMGGIGKTTTAKWYTNKYQDQYTHIIWIESEGPSLLKSFQSLSLELNPEGIQSSVDVQQLVKYIYSRLKDTMSLFIFDNAESYDAKNGLKNILPKNDLHYCIITSRHQEWGNASEFGQISTIQLDVFTNTESNKFLKSVTKEEYSKEMEELGKELGYLPLALHVAAATINKRTRYRTYTISSYLERIRHDIKGLTEQKVLGEYERPVSASLQLTIEQIDNNEDIDSACKELCKTILFISAFCLPEAIELELFGAIPNSDKYVIEDAIQHLQAHSLVRTLPDTEKPTLSIHRLLQVALRSKLETHTDMMTTMLGIAFNCMAMNLDIFGKHAQNAWAIACEYDEAVKKYSEFGISLLSRNIGYITNEEIESTVGAFSNVFSETDLENVQLQLIQGYNLICRNVKYDSSFFTYWSARQQFDDEFQNASNIAERFILIFSNSNRKDHMVQQLTIHAMLLLEFVNYHYQRYQRKSDVLKLNRGVRKGFLKLYKNIIDELETMDYYNGIINGHRLPYCMLWEPRFDTNKLPFRIALTFDYAYLHCYTHQGELALKLLLDYYTKKISDKSTQLMYTCCLYDFIRCHRECFPTDSMNAVVYKCWAYIEQCDKVQRGKFKIILSSTMLEGINACKIMSDISWGYLRVLILQRKLELANEVYRKILSKKGLEESDEEKFDDIQFYSGYDAYCEFRNDQKHQEAYDLCQIIWHSWRHSVKQGGTAQTVTKISIFFSLHSYYTNQLIIREKYEEVVQLEKEMFALLQSFIVLNLFQFGVQTYSEDYDSLPYKQLVDPSKRHALLKVIFRLKLNNYLEITRKAGDEEVFSQQIGIHVGAMNIHAVFREFESVVDLIEIMLKKIREAEAERCFEYFLLRLELETLPLLELLREETTIHKILELLSKYISEMSETLICHDVVVMKLISKYT